MNKDIRKITTMALLVAMALAISLVEHFIPYLFQYQVQNLDFQI